MRADSSRRAPLSLPHQLKAWVPALARLLSGGVGTGTGFAGTYDSMHYPPSEALAVGLHPTDDGKQQQQQPEKTHRQGAISQYPRKAAAARSWCASVSL